MHKLYEIASCFVLDDSKELNHDSCAIIDNPDFIKTHLNRIASDRKLILRSWHLYSADFDELEKKNTAVYTELDHPLNRPGVGAILGSCHGLLCLDNGDEDSIVLWNPKTRKYLISSLLGVQNFQGSECVLRNWHDNVSDDYKVLRIAQSYDCESEVTVFSMKSNSWRKIHCFPHYLKYERPHGHLDGLQLLCFLCVVCNYYVSFYIDIWVMKKYAVKESWTKLFRVSESDVRIKSLENVTPVAYSKSGREVFMVQNGTLPLWYDIEQRTIRYSTFCFSSVRILMEHEL